MKCAYCQRTLYGKVYCCECNESIISCQNCSGFGCYDCKKQLKPYTIKWCTLCKSDKFQAKMYVNGIYKYCYSCVLQKFKSCKTKTIILERYILEVDKYLIYQYLKKYCIQCNKLLPVNNNNSEPVGIKQIYPLDNNLCVNCAHQKNVNKNGKSKSKQFQYPLDAHDDGPQVLQYNQNSRQSSDYERYNYEQQEIQKNSLKETPEQKWKRVQDYKYPQCVACQRRIYGESVITQEMILCRLCYKGSQITQSRLQSENKNLSLKNSRKSNDRYYQNQFSTNSTLPTTYLYERNGQNIMIPTQTKSQHNDDIKNSKILSQKTQNQIKKSQMSINQKKSRAEPVLKKIDSQSRQKISIDIKLPKDEQLIQCSACGIEMEANSSIWQQQKNVPMCRCCFTDLLQQIQTQEKYTNSPLSKNKKFILKHEYEAQQKQKLKQKEKQKIKSPQKLKNVNKQPSISQNKVKQIDVIDNKRSNPINQPIIKQQIKKQSLNKVKRTQSWDQNIIMQPVADHERRKKQKEKRKQGNGIDQIIEQTNDEQQSRSSQNAIYTEEYPSISTQKKQSNDFNIQPIITIDGQQEKDQQLTANTSHQKYSKVQNNQKSHVNTFKQEKIQPLIVQQTQKKNNNVKKLQSWNQQIVLQPVEDHEKRKKQKLLSQQQKEIQQEIQNNIKNQATKIQDRKKSTKVKQKYPKNQNRSSPKYQYQNQLKNGKKQYYQSKPNQNPHYYQRQSPKPAYQEKQYQSPRFQTNQTKYFKKDSSNLQRQIDQKFKNFNRGFNDPFFTRRLNLDDEFDDFKRQTEFDRPRTEARSKFFNQGDNFDRLYSKNFDSPFQQSRFREDDLADRYKKSGQQWRQMGHSHTPKFHQTHNRYTPENPRLASSHYRVIPQQNYATNVNNQKKQVCGMCNKTFILSSRQYRIHNKPACLDCFGQYSRSLKSHQYK